MRKNKTSRSGPGRLFGIIRTYAPTLVRVVIFEVELEFVGPRHFDRITFSDKQRCFRSWKPAGAALVLFGFRVYAQSKARVSTGGVS